MIGRVMAAMPDPPPHEDGAFAQQESVYPLRRSLQNPGDLSNQRRRQPLSGIQMEYPAGMAGQVLLSPVPLRRIIFKSVGEHRGPSPPRDFDGAIGAAGIDDHDLTVKSLEALDASGQVYLLVVSQDHY